MMIDDILNNEVKTLSGGEIQRVAMTLALGYKYFILKKTS